MACPVGESGVPKLARKANYVELRFGPTTTPNETEQSHPSSVRLPRKLLCERFPAIERFLNSPLNGLLDKKGDAETNNVVDMAKLGVSFEEFVLVLHRCATAPILTPEEEFALRKKHNLAGLDDVDLVKCSGKHFWESESAGVEEKETAQKEVDSSVTSSSSSTSEDAADEGGGGGTGCVIGLDGPAMMSPESFRQDLDEAQGASSTRSIYDLMSLFCVPGVEQDFIDVFFRGNIDCLLRDHGGTGVNGVKCCGTPLEPRLIPIHDASGVCRIKSDVKMSWPDDVLLLHAHMGWLRNGNAATKWCSENQKEGDHNAFRNRKDANLHLNMVPAHLRRLSPVQPPAAHHRGAGAITNAIGAFLHKVVGASASSFSFHKDMRWALCGGNAYQALVRGDWLPVCDNAPSDYDLFLILPHILSLPLEERERAAQECATVAIERLYNELRALCGRPLTVHADDPNKGAVETMGRTNAAEAGRSNRALQQQLQSGALVQQERLFLHCIQRSEYAVTFYVSSSRDPDFDGVLVPIQVVGWYSSVTAVLESFDIACCQVALDRGEFFATKKAVTALATGANVVNVNDLSPQYIYRLGKYFGRRMGIAVPLDRNFVVKQTQQSATSIQGITNSSYSNYELGVRCLLSKLVRKWDEHLLEKMTAAEALWKSFSNCPWRWRGPNPPSLAEREELTTSHKQWRREHYSTWMQQTTIPERVALMVLQRQRNDSLAVADMSNQSRIRIHREGEDSFPARVRFPVHTLQTSDTVENVLNENFDLPLVFNHRDAANAGCIVATGGSYLGNRYVGDRYRFNTMEFRKAAASVEEGTSCGARLMGLSADDAFAQHLNSLSKQKRTLTMYISDNLAHILRPESVPQCRASDAPSLAHNSADAASLDGANGVRLNGGSHSESETQAEPVLRIPLPSSQFPRTRKALMKMNAGDPDLVVPEKLRGCFRFKHRDGKGSFEKKDPKEVIEGGQWFTKNVHGEIDHVMRMILGLEEIC